MAQKKDKEPKNTYTIYEDNTMGRVTIANEVIVAVAAIAALEIDGVAHLGGGITLDKASRAGERALSRGVKAELEEGKIHVRLIVYLNYGCSIPETCTKIQERVKSTLENMTGIDVAEVRVSVADIVTQ
ncbi:MAG: Asp23/Gls24 family envelope stress response protein [Eubacteriales bacterium]|nr:Asp23/Gls24 family envelope stress response protein [Eubacteriales bacterium]